MGKQAPSAAAAPPKRGPAPASARTQEVNMLKSELENSQAEVSTLRLYLCNCGMYIYKASVCVPLAASERGIANYCGSFGKRT